jgi:hypothetical protein
MFLCFSSFTSLESAVTFCFLLGPSTCLCFSSLSQRRCKQHVFASLWVLEHLILLGGLSMMPADVAVFPLPSGREATWCWGRLCIGNFESSTSSAF